MNVHDEYFKWICHLVDGRDYTALLRILYKTEFYAVQPLDENRIIDGVELRNKYSEECDIPKEAIKRLFKNDKCNVLEMMVGLAIRIENTIMEDSDFGDRTAMWFWIMIKSLNLYYMRNDHVDEELIVKTLETFLKREYKPSGEGGLFTIKNAQKDLREVEIWYQMCMFFDNLL